MFLSKLHNFVGCSLWQANLRFHGSGGKFVAKQAIPKGGTTKIRFIMLEAEGTEGDIGQIAAAIQSALKPSQTLIQQRLPSATRSVPTIADGGGSDAEDLELDDDDGDVEASTATNTPRVPRDSKPRRYPTPQVLELDLVSPVSFEEYAGKKKPDNDKDRFLVAAAWFKEHRNEASIGVNHVYTCYKKMRWPSAIADFAWPLRSLKKDGLMASGGRGLYAINHIGIGRSDEMGKD